MSAIHLLRCKAEQLPQADAFTKDLTAIEVIESSLLERPTTSVRRGSIWHVGNATRGSEGSISFALGREAVLTAPQFDEKLKEFREVEQKQAPFTVGVFDRDTQTIGVLIRPGVSLNAREVASKLEALLESTGIARRANRRISVDFIPDPTGFIESIRKCYRITRFEFSFTLPNPPDDDKYIQRPLKDFAQRAHATEGKASVKGESLDKDEVIDVATAVAASGDDATANLQMRERSAIVRKRLSANAVRESVEADDHESLAQSILNAMRKAYYLVRNPPSAESMPVE